MNKKMIPIIFSVFITAALLSGCSSIASSQSNSDIIYVDATASGKNNGTSWKDAYNLVQEALSSAQVGQEIWVAKGTYYPTTDGDTSKSFTMVDGVDVYGGFKGSEKLRDERDWENNITILSGDIGVKGNYSDNSIKVVIAANNIIDGFTISDGYFSQSQMEKNKGTKAFQNNQDNNKNAPNKSKNENSNNSAGHMTPSAVTSGDASTSTSGNGIIIWQVASEIRNCIITNNTSGKGAGVYIMGSGNLDQLPTFINTTISNNTAVGRGGGVAIDMMAQAIFIDCIFDGNECTSGKGGAIYNDFGGSPLLENCLFINNKAESGAAIGNDGVSNPVISNCTFYNNTASEAGAALYQGTGPYNDPIIIDSVIWNNFCEQDKVSIYNWNECNPKVEYSIVAGGYDGEGVIDLDPQFVDGENQNFNYKTNSPALTASHSGEEIGFNSNIIEGRNEADYKKIFDYLYSIESSESPIQMDLTNPVTDDDISISSNILFVDGDTSNSGDGSSWSNTFSSLQDAINSANAIYLKNGNEVDVWVAKGTYYPGENRSDSFILRSGVNVYGGFDGSETKISQRNIDENITILSGEILDQSIKEDNSYHVVIGADNALIDGFTITGGYADGVNGEIYDNKGGAILNYLAGNRVRPDITPTLGFDTEISNCTFIDNYGEEGGAVYTYHGGNPIFSNCSFIDNSAQYGGALIDRAGTNSIYRDCSFVNNEATYKGGAVFTDYGAMSSFYNCNFDQNKASTAGGAIYVIDRASQAVPNETDFYLIDDTWTSLTDIFSSVYIDNCSFSDNVAKTNGGALYVYEGSFAKIISSSFFNNVSNDAAIVASNSAVVFIDELTTFYNNLVQDSLADGNRSEIVFEN